MKRARFIVEEMAGSGSESLYVYFADSERRLAQLEGRTSWPCKIGRTSHDVGERILQQRPFTAMAALPVVGLVVRTSNAVALESSVHDVLRRLQARVGSALGRDWFHTSPQQVRDIAEGALTVPAVSKRRARVAQSWNPPTTGLLGELFQDVIQFLAETRMAESAFGKQATGNCALIHGIRRGGDVRASTYDKMRRYMATERANRLAVAVA